MIRAWHLAVISLICCFNELRAAERPRVGVDFELTVPFFQEPFTDLIGVQRLVSQHLANKLQAEFGFLEFNALPTNEYTLRVQIYPEESSVGNGAPIKTLFKVTLWRGETGIGRGIDDWLFREPRDFPAAVSTRTFTNEISNKFKERLSENRSRLVKDLFSSIRLADRAYFVVAPHRPARYAVPLKRELFRIGQETKFDFTVLDAINQEELHYVAMVPTREPEQRIDLPNEFGEGIWAFPDARPIDLGYSTTAITNVATNGIISGTALYITEYRKLVR